MADDRDRLMSAFVERVTDQANKFQAQLLAMDPKERMAPDLPRGHDMPMQARVFAVVCVEEAQAVARDVWRERSSAVGRPGKLVGARSSQGLPHSDPPVSSNLRARGAPCTGNFSLCPRRASHRVLPAALG